MALSLEQVAVNKVVKDIYGREVGRAVGVLLDLSGSVQSVGVNEGAGRLVLYPKERISTRDGDYMIVPEWKVDVQALIRERDAIRRREYALELMATSGTSAPKALDELKRSFRDARSAHDKLKERLAARISELEDNDESIQNFAAMARLQHATNEIDEKSFKSANDYCDTVISADAKEKDDLRKAIGFIEDIEEAPAQAPKPTGRSSRSKQPVAAPVPQAPAPAQIVSPTPFPEFRLSPTAFRMPEPSPN